MTPPKEHSDTGFRSGACSRGSGRCACFSASTKAVRVVVFKAIDKYLEEVNYAEWWVPENCFTNWVYVYMIRCSHSCDQNYITK